MALPGQTLQRGGKERVEITSVHHWHSDSVELNTPLTLVELQVLQEELLADVAEPSVVPLQRGALQPWLPELKVVLAVSVTDSALIVLVSDAGVTAGHRQRPDGVTIEDVLLTASPHLLRAPVRGALVPDVEVAVLPQLFTAELPVVLPLLLGIEVY